MERQAGESASPLAVGIPQHPLVDRQEELDRAAAEDDGTGRTSAWHSLGHRGGGARCRQASAAGSVRHAVIEKQNATRAEGLVDALVNADITKVPSIVSDLEKYRTWADPLLKAKFDQAKEGSSQRLNMALALLPVDATQAELLYDQLARRRAERNSPWSVMPWPPTRTTGRSSCGPSWKLDSKREGQQRLRAACALAKYDPDDQRWTQGRRPSSPEDLVSVDPVFLDLDGKLSSGQKPACWDHWRAFTENNVRKEQQRSFADETAGRLRRRPTPGAGRSGHERRRQAIRHHLHETPAARRRGTAVVARRNDKQPVPDASEEAKEALARRQANAAVALLKMDHAAKVWPLLKHSPDPRVRSWIDP